jgi:hypothetical protein
MVQPKPLALPTSSLLARKGAARPAMRIQDSTDSGPNSDDLGWNDMGGFVPPVLVERIALKLEIERTAVAKAAVSKATLARIGLEISSRVKNGKVASTLRLDSDRHLRLRLAAAVTGKSSQRLVTQALDAFFQSLPEVDALIAQLPSPKPIR